MFLPDLEGTDPARYYSAALAPVVRREWDANRPKRGKTTLGSAASKM